MKRFLTAATLLLTLTLPTVASANVSKATISVGKTAKWCFVQMFLQTVEQNMFNGLEKAQVNTTELTTFEPLKTAGKSVAANKNVLAATADFATETGLTADLTLSAALCALLVPSSTVELLGSFGPSAGKITLPATFGDDMVATDDGIINLAEAQYTVKSLDGEKTIGSLGRGGPSSSSGTSGSTSSSSSSSSGASGSTSSSSGETPSAPANDDSCTISRAPGGSSSAPRLLSGAVLVGAVMAARRRRRAH
jgi:hypothetical protein